MKVLNFVGGTAAIRVIGDAVTPMRPLPSDVLVSYIAGRYRFAGRPSPNMVAPSILQTLAFQQGKIQIDNDLLAVDQLMLFPNGDAVVTRDTETADRVLNDFMLDLDKSCGYRFKDALSERLYQSALSVEFDQKFVERARVFSIFRNAARAARDASEKYAKGPWLKKLVVGWEDNPFTSPQTLVDQIISTDFAIEPRAGVSLEARVYFSAAPLRTTDHVRYLEQVEAEVIALEK